MAWTVGHQARLLGLREVLRPRKPGRPAGRLKSYRGLTLAHPRARAIVDEPFAQRNRQKCFKHVEGDQWEGVYGAADLALCILQILQTRSWCGLPTIPLKEDVDGGFDVNRVHEVLLALGEAGVAAVDIAMAASMAEGDRAHHRLGRLWFPTLSPAGLQRKPRPKN